jgi:hypothetical protein
MEYLKGKKIAIERANSTKVNFVDKRLELILIYFI